MLLYERLTDEAFLLTKGSKLAAGFDIKSPRDYIIPAQKNTLIPSDIRVRIPKNYYGRLVIRSGLAKDYNLDVKGGVIDRDYTGNVGIILFNHGDKDYNVKRGDRIAQLIIEGCLYIDACEISEEEKKMATGKRAKLNNDKDDAINNNVVVDDDDATTTNTTIAAGDNNNTATVIDVIMTTDRGSNGFGSTGK